MIFCSISTRLSAGWNKVLPDQQSVHKADLRPEYHVIQRPSAFYRNKKPANQMVHMYTFIVTTMESEPYQVIQFYCGRGSMENFIKEGKSGFDFASVSSRSRVVNANRLQVHMLAYNLFNWFRRLALAANMRKQRIDTIRLKLLKIAVKVVHSARYTLFKLCSSCPYKQEFYQTLKNIDRLQPQIE